MIESPCIRQCCLNEQDICLGCFRSLDEIKLWREVDEATQQTFLQQAQQRRERYRQKQTKVLSNIE